MVKVDNSFRFEGKIKDYERVILDYQLELAHFSSLSDTLGKIMAYLSLYKRLTQSQLKILTNFSKSTISTGLSTFINTGYIRKEKLNRSREYEYFITPRSQESIDFALGSMEDEIAFFNKKINELENKPLKRKKGYELILVRLKDALDVYECYQNILKFLKDPNSDVEIKLKREHKNTLILEDFELIFLSFDPEIEKIEDEILNYFMYESAYSILTEFTLKINTIFLLRKVLTQEWIRELTGLSLGKVSQVVNDLVRKGYIEKVDKKIYSNIIPKEIKRQTIYSIASIKDSFFYSGINSFKEMLKWEDKFKEIKKELIKSKGELEKLRGFNQVLNSIDEYLAIIPIYKKASSIFSKLLE